jgi:hypothetical protein
MAYKFQKGHADMSGSLTQLGAIIVSGTLSASAAIDGASLKIGTTEVISSARELKNIATIDAGSQQVIEDYMISLDNLTSAGATGVDLDVQGPLDLIEGLKQNGTIVLTDAGALQNLVSVSASSDIAGGQLNVRGAVSGAIATATYMTASGHVSASQFFGNGAGLKGISSDNVDTVGSTADQTFYVPFVTGSGDADGTILYIQDSMQLNPSDDSVVVLGALQGGSLKAANLNAGHLPLIGANGLIEENALFQYSDTRTGPAPNVTIFVSSSASGSAALGDGVIFVADEADNDVFVATSGSLEFYPAPGSIPTQKLAVEKNEFGFYEAASSKGLVVDLASSEVAILPNTLLLANGPAEFNGTADFNDTIFSNSKLRAEGEISGSANLITSGTADLRGDVKLGFSGVGTEVRGDMTVQQFAQFNGTLKTNDKLWATDMISGSAGLSLSGAVNLQGDVKLGLAGVGTEVRGDMTVQQQADFNAQLNSNNKLVATGMISGSAGLALSGAVNLQGDVKLGLAGVGTEVRGDMSVQQNATFQDSVTIQNSKYLTLNGGSSHIFLNGVNCLITGSGGISLSSSLNMGGNATFGGNVVSDGFGQFAGKITVNGTGSFIDVDGDTLAPDDAIYFREDSGAGWMKKVTLVNFGDYFAGNGLTHDPSTGVISTTDYAAPNAIGNADATLEPGVNWGDTTLGAVRDWTLPLSADTDVGDRVVVKAPVVGAHHIRILPQAGQQIDGGTAALNLEADYAAVELLYVAADNWRVV